MYSGFTYPIKLLEMLFDSPGSETFKMTAYKTGIFGMDAAILESPLPFRSYNILKSCIVKLDLKNIMYVASVFI